MKLSLYKVTLGSGTLWSATIKHVLAESYSEAAVKAAEWEEEDRRQRGEKGGIFGDHGSIKPEFLGKDEYVAKPVKIVELLEEDVIV